MRCIGKLNFQHGRSERVEDWMREFQSHAYRKREVELNGTWVPAYHSIVLRTYQYSTILKCVLSLPIISLYYNIHPYQSGKDSYTNRTTHFLAPTN